MYVEQKTMWYKILMAMYEIESGRHGGSIRWLSIEVWGWQWVIGLMTIWIG